MCWVGCVTRDPDSWANGLFVQAISLFIYSWFKSRCLCVCDPVQSQVSERLLPQWATGLIAVAGFLFLSVVGLLVKKAWCEEPKRSVRNKDVLTTWLKLEGQGPGFYLCPCHSSTRCVSCICSEWVHLWGQREKTLLWWPTTSVTLHWTWSGMWDSLTFRTQTLVMWPMLAHAHDEKCPKFRKNVIFYIILKLFIFVYIYVYICLYTYLSYLLLVVCW